jgi:mycothiol synthase
VTTPQLSWTADPTAEQVADVQDLLRAASRADGVDAVGEQVVRSLHHSALHHSALHHSALHHSAPDHSAAAAPHLLATVDGRVRGYAHREPAVADGPAFVELAVHPEHRRAGTGSALLEEALTGTARVWAHGDGAPARALAARAGLVSVRELWQMRVDLTAVELPGLPQREDVVLRTYAGADDDEAVLAVNNAAFSWHPEQGGWSRQDIADRRTEPWFDAAGFFLAEDAAEDALLGFHWTKVHPSEGGEPPLGEVYVVGIAPAAQGRGIGRLLTLAGLLHLRDAGLATVLLYVEGDNAAAVHTYERLGFARFHVDRAWARS